MKDQQRTRKQDVEELALLRQRVSELEAAKGEREKAEEALKQSEEKFRFLTENMADIVWTVDRNFRTTYVSPSVEKVLGFTPEERREQAVEEMITPESLQRIRSMFVDELRHEKEGGADPDRSVTTEIEYYRKDGSTLWMENNVKALRGPAGHWVGFWGVSRDIDARKRAEEALKESEARFRAAFENAAVGMALVDLEGNYQEANDAMAAMIGYTPAELIGKPVAQFTHSDDLESRAGFVEDLLAGRITSGEQERRLLHRDGTHIWALIWAKVQRDSEGRPLRFVSLVLNNTARKRAEEERERLQAQLVQAQKMEAVGRLAGGVAHDFNNKLTAILGYTDLALHMGEMESPLRRNLEEIQKAGQRAADLVRQLLAFARKQTVSPQALDLNDTVEDLLRMLRRLIGEDIHLAWMPDPELWTVRMDPSQIDQILANLVVNARDAIHGSGKIAIGTTNVILDRRFCGEHPGSIPGEYVRLEVSDDGCGMDKAVMEHLFEPFFTTKDVGKGTGLGLATVFGIVKQNQGYIDVHSQPGEGTTFQIYLPRFTAPAAGTGGGGRETTPQGGTETLLLVEDEHAVLGLGRTILEGLGYSVLTAGTPAEALRVAGEHPAAIHLLITDVVMPEMNGRELYDRLSVSRPGLKCLYMSGYTADVIAHQGVLDEGVQFIQKPFTTEWLARKVREALGGM